MTTKTWKTPDTAVGARIDKHLSETLEMTRSAVQTLLDDGHITVNGKAVGKNYRLRAEDTVSAEIPAPVAYEAEPENIPLDIVYEDAHLLVVNKPKGMVVHPAAGNYSGTLVNALLYHCGDSLSGINGVMRPGIVHRIDKDTSGLLIVAKDDKAHNGLAEQIKAHTFTRVYETVVYGNVKNDSGTVSAPIGRHPVHRKKQAVTPVNSKDATTHYEVIERFAGTANTSAYTHLRCRLETGRTHQIRVHMAYIGHPVAGDTVYGPEKHKELGGQCLHARVIGFVHPITGEYLEFTSPLPDYFETFLQKLQKNNG